MARKSYRKTKFQFTKPLGLLIAFFAVILVVGIITVQPTKKERLYNAFIDDSGSNILEVDHNLEEVNVKQLKKQVESAEQGKYIFLLYGSASSSETVSNLSAIMQYTEYFEIETLYFLDSTNYSASVDDDGNTVTKIEDSTVGKLANEINIKGVTAKAFLQAPGILVFKNNECVFSFADYYNDEDQLTDGYTVLSLTLQAFSINIEEKPIV